MYNWPYNHKTLYKRNMKGYEKKQLKWETICILVI